MEHLLPTLPNYVVIFIVILWAGDKFLLPAFSKVLDKKGDKDRLADIKSELAELQHEVHEWSEKYHMLDISHRALQAKYNNIIGMLRGFQVYLREKGASDFPMMDDLVKHTGEDHT